MKYTKEQMMLKKRLVVIAFTLILPVMLIACGGSATEATGEALSTKTGVLIEASMHVVSIQAPDGTTYTFGIDDNTTVEGSEVLGNTMSVSYNGDYYSGTIAVKITTVTEAAQTSASGGKGSTDAPGAPQPSNPPASQEKLWYITGTVQDVSMNQLQLLYEDGNTYTVLKDDNTKTAEGIVVGCVARVFHKGNIKDGMIATEIQLISPPTQDGGGTSSTADGGVMYLTGTVTDASMNSLQLLYEDGKTYTIIKDDNTKTDEGIVVGSTVRVYHVGVLADQMIATEIRLVS